MSNWKIALLLRLADGTFRVKNDTFTKDIGYNVEADKLLAGREYCRCQIYFDSDEDRVYIIKEM